MGPAHDGTTTDMNNYTHPYTPQGYLDTANTLSCHQIGGLIHHTDLTIRPVDMGKFQALHLLEAGYCIVYDPEHAKELLDSGRKHGHII